MPAEKNRRRYRRIPWINPVRISWEERDQPRFALAKCINISEFGIRLESPCPVQPGTRIMLASERIKLTGSATVRHMVRHGSKYLLGLQLTSAILGKTIAELESQPIAAVLIENFNRLDQNV